MMLFKTELLPDFDIFSFLRSSQLSDVLINIQFCEEEGGDGGGEEVLQRNANERIIASEKGRDAEMHNAIANELISQSVCNVVVN